MPFPPVQLLRLLVLWVLLAPIAKGQEGFLSQGRTAFVNKFILDLFAPFRTQVYKTEVGLSEVKLKEISVLDPKSGKLVLSIREVSWRPQWTAIPSGEYGEVSLQGLRLTISPQTERAVADWFKPDPKAKASKGLLLRKMELKDTRIKCQAGDLIPTIESSLDLQLSDLDTRHGIFQLGRLLINGREVKVQPKDSTEPVLDLATLQIEASLSGAGHLHISRCELPGGKLYWCSEIEKLLLKKTAPVSAANTTPAPSLIKTLLLDQLTLGPMQLRLDQTSSVPYVGRGQLELKLKALRWDGQQILSAEAQQLELRELSAAYHPLSRSNPLATFVKLQSGSFRVTPDAWHKDQRVDQLVLNKPLLHLRDDNTPWFKDNPSAVPATPDKEPSAASPIHHLHFGQLSIVDGSLAYAARHGQRIDFSSRINVVQEGFKSTNNLPFHRITLHSVKLLVPQKSPLPVANIAEVESTIEMPVLWQQHRLETLRIKGGDIEVGDALMALQGDGSATKTNQVATPAAPAEGSDWVINRTTLKDTNITLKNIVPGLSSMKFTLDYETWQLPLDLQKMRGRSEKQTVEVTNLAIRSPYDSLRDVARLPHVFVEFSLDGLAQQRIEGVKIVSPTLLIGEDLFWYIDYYRKYTAGENLDERQKNIAIALASTAKADAFGAALQMEEIPVVAASNPAWSIGTIAVNSGKLVIAPKGYPLPGIPRPFPFSFISKLDDGKFETELEIPSDDYVWEPIKLKLEGLSGKVLFNLPLKTKDNNLTETFTVKRIRYKKFHIEDAHLSVTYDAAGIYGQFGGAAYTGYVKGAFNIYLGKDYPWDGWITGSSVTTTEITQLLCPAYFLLDGKVDLTVITNGNEKTIFQTDLKFKNSSPGKFSVIALNDMIAALPGDWPGYMQDGFRIGIETLRDFKYDSVDCTGRLYGRNGQGYMKFKGPHGSRNIDIHLHDRRKGVQAEAPPAKPLHQP